MSAWTIDSRDIQTMRMMFNKVEIRWWLWFRYDDLPVSSSSSSLECDVEREKQKLNCLTESILTHELTTVWTLLWFRLKCSWVCFCELWKRNFLLSQHVMRHDFVLKKIAVMSDWTFPFDGDDVWDADRRWGGDEISILSHVICIHRKWAVLYILHRHDDDVVCLMFCGCDDSPLFICSSHPPDSDNHVE